MADPTHVVTSFLRDGGEVLLIRRSDEVGTYRGLWGAVSGYAEGAPDELARVEIDEETGLLDEATLVRSGEPLSVEDDGWEWIVHPYLFDCDSRAVDPNEEVAEYEWVAPTEILRRETVPSLWEAYDRVGPTVETVRDDATHGSAYVSVRALGVLRDRAGAAAAGGGDWGDLAELAADLVDARPDMTAPATRVARAMADASGDRTPAGVERAAREAIERARSADDEAAGAAAERVGDEVLTLSRSGTVREAIRRAEPSTVICLESRPAREGVDVAEDLAESGRSVTVALDASVAQLIADREPSVLVGADAVLADGSVVNKVGTRTAAVAAEARDVPFRAVAATAKIAPDAGVTPREGDPATIYDGDAPIEIDARVFDRTPADAVDAILTEEGALNRDDVERIAERHGRLLAWAGSGFEGDLPG